jgi:hypothetical protein
MDADALAVAVPKEHRGCTGRVLGIHALPFSWSK